MSASGLRRLPLRRAAAAFCCAMACATSFARPGGASAPSSAGSAASGPRSKIAPQVRNQADFDKLDCPTQQRVYRESLDCFAPYIQQRPFQAPPEAFQKCVELRDPSARCGIPVAP